MKLSIIILNYQSEGLMQYCIESISRLELPCAYEILALNGNPFSSIDEFAIRWPRVTVLQLPKNRGMGANNNVGIRAAQGEYVLILNPDIVVLPGAIESLIRVLDTQPRAQMVVPKLLRPDRQLQYTTYRFPSFFLPIYLRTFLGRWGRGAEIRRWYQMRDWDHNDTRAIEGWAQGSAMLVRKSFFDLAGGFDERFFMYLEDTDLCRRIWQSRGEVWYDATAIMIHYFGHASAEKPWYLSLFNRLAWVHVASWLKYFWKWRKQKLKTQNE